LMELANLPDDPRVALRLAELVSIFGVSPQRTQYWKSLLEQLARIGDVRTCEPLRVAFRDFTNKYFDHHRQAKRIIRDFVVQPPSIAALPAADRALIGELSRTIDQAEAKSLARTLVAAVAADWTDDGPRLVYADWLSEREHPRGEAIVLECKRGRTQAEDARLTELRESAYLYGAVHDLAELKPEHCDRGIPVRLVLKWSAGSLNWRALANHPLVALIESLDVGEVQQPPTADDLVAFVKTATRLQAIERAEEDGEHVLWSFANAALPGFRRERGRFVRR
jgi:uncharacterized protein (TIGR02996 family)